MLATALVLDLYVVGTAAPLTRMTMPGRKPIPCTVTAVVAPAGRDSGTTPVMVAKRVTTLSVKVVPAPSPPGAGFWAVRVKLEGASMGTGTATVASLLVMMVVGRAVPL